MKNIKAVVFDIGGVLVDLNLERCIRSFKELGFTEIENYVNCYHPAEFFGELERGEITPAEFCDKLREVAHIDCTDDEIQRAHRSILESIPVEKLRLMERLRKRGLRIYALSNMSAVMIGRIEELMEADSHNAEYYFDQMFISYQMGLMKPSPEIYERMLQHIGIPANEILFIDDSIENIEEGKRHGMECYLASEREDFSHIFEE